MAGQLLPRIFLDVYTKRQDRDTVFRYVQGTNLWVRHRGTEVEKR